jgi:hypothetical protein
MLAHPVFAGAFAVLSLLVFCWPFVRAPAPHLAHAALHLFAAWAVVVLVLSQVGRRVGEPPPDQAGRGAGEGGAEDGGGSGGAERGGGDRDA